MKKQETKEMRTYSNYTKDSIVKAYGIAPEAITVEFTNGEVYTYSARSVGHHHLDTMKQLAQSGQGLGKYIEEVVKYGYARQVR